MRVSQRLDYALRTLVMLAGEEPGARVAAGDLADRLGLPRRFVEQQVTALSRAGIVTCRRGATGGCALSKPADQVSVSDVVRAMHGQVLDVPHQSRSASAELWAEAAGRLAEFLGGVTLADLAARQAALAAEEAPVYFI